MEYVRPLLNCILIGFFIAFFICFVLPILLVLLVLGMIFCPQKVRGTYQKVRTGAGGFTGKWKRNPGATAEPPKQQSQNSDTIDVEYTVLDSKEVNK